HVAEMLAVRKRGVANRLYRALGRFIALGQIGALPASARRILGSAAMFLDKPGREALLRARATIEEVAATGALGPLAVVDGDLVSCFGSFEWPAIPAWCTRAAAEARLPCGDTVFVDRGSGQSEPDGTPMAPTTIGARARGVKDDTASADLGEWVHGWFLDDGQIYSRPHQL
ncbi:unnamed protein product, partial [Prorocentrum cordatum]